MSKRNVVVTIKGQPLPTEQSAEQRMSELVRGLVPLSVEDRKAALLEGLSAEVARAECEQARPAGRRSADTSKPYSHRAVQVATDAVLRHLERKGGQPHRKVSNQ